MRADRQRRMHGSERASSLARLPGLRLRPGAGTRREAAALQRQEARPRTGNGERYITSSRGRIILPFLSRSEQPIYVYTNDTPQGKLEMWIDMFQVGQLPPRAAVDIAPQAPERYEIRVIIWNTEDVPLVESQFLTGEKSSDIYVKGYAIVNIWEKGGGGEKGGEREEEECFSLD